MKAKKVVITGVGVVSPIGIGKEDFYEALLKGQSGIRFQTELEALNFRCHIAGIPDIDEKVKKQFINEYKLIKLRSSGILFACMAGIEAWMDAGLSISSRLAEAPDWKSGCIYGSSSTGAEPTAYGIKLLESGKVKQLGSRLVQQTMTNSASAYLGGLLGLGNQVSSNSSACSTGTEAVLIAYERIKSGKADRMLAGSTESQGPLVWAGFDSMLVLTEGFNNAPKKGSRPMSDSASGFVPGAGAGALLLESLEEAERRGAKIYAEVLGGALNSGGHRGGGSMTAANTQGMQRCISTAVEYSGITPDEIDAISGHLTSTIGDRFEIESWAIALNRNGKDFPFINALKSLTGHCLSASSAIELVAVALQLERDFFYPNLNCEDLHPAIRKWVDPEKIPMTALRNTGFKTMVKASFGFGDVNACLVLKKWDTK